MEIAEDRQQGEGGKGREKKNLKKGGACSRCRWQAVIMPRRAYAPRGQTGRGVRA